MNYGEKRCYDLGCLPRIFSYSYQLSSIGWLPHHIYIHRNNVIQSLYICLSSGSETISEREVNGVRQKTLPYHSYHFGMVLPGTKLNTIHASYHDELYFVYDGACIQNMLNFLGGPRSFYFQTLPEDTIAELRMLLSNRTVPGVADQIDQLAIRLFSELILEHDSAPPVNAGGGKGLQMQSIAHKLVRGEDLAHLLKEYGISQRTFYREWKDFFDLSPAKYVMLQRLYSAAQMLQNTALSISEIAERCGFSNLTYFYECFRKKYGCPPKEYKNAKGSLQK